MSHSSYLGANLTIDLVALKKNYRTLTDKLLPAKLAAVVKANAYVPILTERCFASCGSEGIKSPGANSPAVICSCRKFSTTLYNGVPGTFLIGHCVINSLKTCD